ncbi:hypothetical protein ACFX13_020174 [Malus domestica]
MFAFRGAIADCQLTNLRFLGNPSTWKTTRVGGIKEHLDRYCALTSWKGMFHILKVSQLKFGKSDHILVLLELSQSHVKRNHHVFRFEEAWTHHENCEEVIRKAWSLNVVEYPMFQVYEKIKATRAAFLEWQ